MFIAGIVLLGVIALGLALFFYVVKRRQAREVERLQQQREARRRRAAERRAREALEAEQRVASIPIKSVVPGALGGARIQLALGCKTCKTWRQLHACCSSWSSYSAWRQHPSALPGQQTSSIPPPAVQACVTSRQLVLQAASLCYKSIQRHPLCLPFRASSRRSLHHAARWAAHPCGAHRL